MKAVMEVLLPADERDADAVLILAGDISNHRSHWEWLGLHMAERFKHVILIAGNHEHYGHDLADWDVWAKKAEAEIRKESKNGNISISWNSDVNWIEVGGVNYLFSTLWTKPSEIMKAIPNPRYADFYQVSNNKENRQFSYDDMERMYLRQSAAFEKGMQIIRQKDPNAKIVIATHHPPLQDFLDPKYARGPLDSLFAADCSKMLRDIAPTIWAFGHTHYAVDRYLGDTRYINNPVGYPQGGSMVTGEGNYNEFCFVKV